MNNTLMLNPCTQKWNPKFTHTEKQNPLMMHNLYKVHAHRKPESIDNA